MNNPHCEKLSGSDDTAGEISPINPGSSRPISLHENRRASKKRVKWDRIHRREYSLVVGDHPLCHDGLPVSLGWQYNDCCPDSLVEARERKESYVCPRRLSYDERRQRLLFSGGLSPEQVKSDEIDLIVRTLNEAWETSGMDDMDLVDPLSDIDMLGDDNTLLDMDVDLVDISNFEWTD